ncbi:hypothetical protein F5884DRAFT_885273 [Xylogone sp. PMI_703]|nr:hypothetical protein F5884DRAFT_885273 [Xylogone sp. PMI_703]
MVPQASLASPIALWGRACDSHFDQLCALFEDKERQFIYDISHLQICDSYSQFKIWAGNIGALQTIQSASSLDYRLREAPKVSKQVVALLEDLDETLEDGIHSIQFCYLMIVIVNSVLTALSFRHRLWERQNRVSSPMPFNSELLVDDGTDRSEMVIYPLESAPGSISEIQELFQSIPETIASLFNLSILIRSSSSRDRYAKALAAASKSPFDDRFDIDHVGNKFPCLYRDDGEWLRERLGKAITQRRHYLRYCREHREKLSKLPEPRNTAEEIPESKISTTFLAVQRQQDSVPYDAQTVISRPTSTLASTTASTVIPAQLESTEHLDKLEEQNEDDNRSQTSYATSVGEDDSDSRLSVVRLEEVAGTGQSFECPYCWTIQRIKNQQAWRKHVMRDLKPYVCTSKECDMKLFQDRYTWFTHELQNHFVEWSCCFCSQSYATRDNFDKHVRKLHADKFTDDQLSALAKVCQQPMEKFSPSACPFCDGWEDKLRELNKHMSANDILVVTPQQFHHHVGSHMEQLALFAIPRGYKEDEDAGSSRAAPGHGSDDSSDRSFIRPDYEDEDNPRLHVAAFEGLKDEVKALLEENSAQIGLDPTQSIQFEAGSTWGSALSAAAAGGHVDIADLCLPREKHTKKASADLINHLPRSKTKGWGPLHWAASNGHLGIIDLLIENGISISDKAVDGSTAADLAYKHGHREIVQVLEGNQQKLSDTQPGLADSSQQPIQHKLRVTIIAADRLYKRDIFSFPDPFAVVTVSGEQTKVTSVI